jgi:CTP:phosphocholine cytidylyltransferase-like protein
MFYKKGIDITNYKQMFNFLKDHYTYSTLNSWNGLRSIANNVKIYNLKLSGDCWNALTFLQNDDYFTINMMIEDWEAEHRGYSVGFNGRSGGYLVLYNDHNNRSALPDEIDECEDYEEYKRWCKDYCGSVKENRRDLVETVRLVQDFDKLCDQLRDYVNELSVKDFAQEALEEVVDRFNENYYDDLHLLGIRELEIKDGKVFIGDICELDCLYEAFCRVANKKDVGYKLERDGNFVKFVEA